MGLHCLLTDKEKEGLFIVAYNVTDNISSQAILRHNNIFKGDSNPNDKYVSSERAL